MLHINYYIVWTIFFDTWGVTRNMNKQLSHIFVCSIIRKQELMSHRMSVQVRPIENKPHCWG